MRLRDCVDKLAAAIDAGQVEPDAPTLEALAIICDRHGLTADAARVRRWLHNVGATIIEASS